MKIIRKLLCCMLAVLFCVSMVACSRQVITESWISEGNNGDVSDTQSGDSNADNSKDESSNADNSKDESSQDDKKTTSATKSPKQTTTQKKRGSNDTVYRNVTIKSSSTKLEDSVKSTFKGKTYKAIAWTETATTSYSAELQAFAAQYGCKIEEKKVNFEQVLTTLSTALSSGDAYDIIRIQGSWYPRILISNLLAPLEDAFTTADLVTGSNQDGIDLEKSKYFSWNNSLYAVTTYDDVPIYYLYYNKKILKDDIWKLYKNGQWTWEKMKELAGRYTNAAQNVYWSDLSMVSKAMVMSNNTKLVKETETADGVKLQAFISDNKNFRNALSFGQGMLGKGRGTGIYKSELVLRNDGGSDKLDNLLNGNIVVWPSESNRYQSLYKRIKTEGSGFDKKVENLGVAPLPYGVDNEKTKAYAAGWLTAFGAGRGSDATAPKLVAALCKFHSTYNTAPSNALDKEAYEAEQAAKEQMKDLYANLNYCDFGYGTGDGTLDKVLTEIENAVKQGKDITSTMKRYDDTAASYLSASLSQQ